MININNKKEDVIAPFFYNGLIKNQLYNNEKCCYLDIINRNNIELGRSCLEYLAYSGNINQNIIVPIPIKYCFKNIKDKDEKINKINEYINYLNSNDLFKFNIINDKELNNKLINHYFNKSLTYKKKQINLINLLIENNVSDPGSIIIDSYNYSLIKLNNTQYSKFKEEINNIIKNKFSHLFTDKKTNYELIINNFNELKDSFTNRRLDLFSILDKKSKNIKSIHNFNISFYNCYNKNSLYAKHSFNKEKSNLDLKNSLIFNLKNEYINSEELPNLYIDILKTYLKHGNSININDRYQNIYKYLNCFSDYINDDKIIVKDYISEYKEKIKDEFLFVSINIKKSNIKFKSKLLLHVTLLRYMFYNDVSHLSEIILNFKNNCKSLTLLENLFISSHFHNDKAWHRYNIINCRTPENLGKKDYNEVTYYSLCENYDEKVINLLKDKNNSNSINSIFSLANNLFLTNKKEEVKKIYNKLNRYYNNNNLEKIVNLFKKSKK